MVKPIISTNELLALKFFTALGKDDYEEYLCLLKSPSFDYSTGMQSLRMKAFVNSGKCDARNKIQIWLITGLHCNG